jgi:ribosome biogenesis GTPase
MSQYINLKKYGLSEHFEQEAATYGGLFPARVTGQLRDLYRVVSVAGESNAKTSTIANCTNRFKY